MDHLKQKRTSFTRMINDHIKQIRGILILNWLHLLHHPETPPLHTTTYNTPTHTEHAHTKDSKRNKLCCHIHSEHFRMLCLDKHQHK